jgi:hypothetical protein
MTTTHTAVETVLSPRFPRPVLAKNGRAATFANRTQAHAAAARVTAQGAACWVTARHPFLVVVELHDGGSPDVTGTAQRSFSVGAATLASQAHEAPGDVWSADRTKSGQNGPAVNPGSTWGAHV